MLLQEEKTNLGRQKEFDIVKALAIFFMVIVHCYEMIFNCNEALPSNAFELLIEFTGGPLAAPVFMFSMGLGMVYTKHRSPGDLLKRGLKLLVFSYIFNLIRFVIPGLLGQYEGYPIVFLAFHVDILTFAGMTFILTALFKKIKLPVWGLVVVAVLMQALGTLLGYYSPIEQEGLNYLTAIFYSSHYSSYFPLLLWYIYPVLGILFGKYLKHIENKNRFYLFILLVSSAIMLSLVTTLSYFQFDVRKLFALVDNVYYKQTVVHVLFTACCILMEVSIVYFISKVIKISLLDKFIHYMSSNLNLIYIMQWLIIGWVACTGKIIVPAWAVIPCGVLIVGISAALAYPTKLLINKIKYKFVKY